MVIIILVPLEEIQKVIKWIFIQFVLNIRGEKLNEKNSPNMFFGVLCFVNYNFDSSVSGILQSSDGN
jgi:hypothetical protein